MTGTPPRVRGDAPGAADALASLLDDHEAVLVHRGVEFAGGAAERVLAELHRPHRRLVRVHTTTGGCYLARSELLHLALVHGVPAEDLVTDGPGLDRALARASDVVPPDGPTPVEDPAAGRWRVWVDGRAVGIRGLGEGAAAGHAERDGWAEEVAVRHRPRARVVAAARRRAGRVRREVVRLRQRRV